MLFSAGLLLASAVLFLCKGNRFELTIFQTYIVAAIFDCLFLTIFVIVVAIQSFRYGRYVPTNADASVQHTFVIKIMINLLAIIASQNARKLVAEKHSENLKIAESI